jgi:Domain of unknown function (DUF222)/HNH endonuclease
MEPGPAAMAWLGSVHPMQLEEFDRVALVAEWERQLSWLMAQTQVALVAVAGPDPTLGDDWVREEVGCALGLSSRAAGARIAIARALCGTLPATLAMLGTGALGWRHALAVVEECGGLDGPTAAAVQAAVLPTAAGQRWGALRKALRKALLVAVPDHDTVRREEALAGRNVEVCRGDWGMSLLVATLPTAEAVAVGRILDKIARADQARLPDRKTGPGLPALRADALVALLTGSRHPIATNPAVRVDLQVVVDAATWLGLADNPGELVGYGPIPADLARALAADAAWRRLITDPVTGVLLDYGRSVYRAPAALREFVEARDRTCRFPGCERLARNNDVDHRTPWSKGGRTCSANCMSLCRRHHRLKTHTLWRVEADDADGTITWTSPTGHTYKTRPPPQL